MLFVMGSTGRMGGAVLRHATGRVRAATRSGAPVDGADDTVRFDLEDAHSFPAALAGCTDIFVVRPPPTTTRAPFERLMEAAREAGVRHVVCAQVYGADTSRVLPHRHMEAAVRASGLPHTFLRPADFMQNLADVHGNPQVLTSNIEHYFIDDREVADIYLKFERLPEDIRRLERERPSLEGLHEIVSRLRAKGGVRPPQTSWQRLFSDRDHLQPVVYFFNKRLIDRFYPQFE